MLDLIYGGSASGKSTYAEKLADAYYNQLNTKYYVATMQVFDKESEKRVEKHRFQRKDQHFETLEIPMNIDLLVKRFANQKNQVFLVECMSNLLANELFSNDWRTDEMDDETLCMQIKERIIRPLIALSKEHHVVVVGNDVFGDGVTYDDIGMKQYISAFGYIHQELAKGAKNVVRVVASIPICIKGELPCYDL